MTTGETPKTIGQEIGTGTYCPCCEAVDRIGGEAVGGLASVQQVRPGSAH